MTGLGSDGRELALAQAVRALALDRELAEIVAAFAAVGVRPLLLKGPAFARWLYDDVGERPYGDIDLLIAPEQFFLAEQALARRGFEPAISAGRGWRVGEYHRHSHDWRWLRRGACPARVELHHTLGLVPAPAALVWRRLSESPRVIEVAGVLIEVPALPAAALIVALHAVLHGADAKPLRDLRKALERVDAVTWRAAAALALELGAGGAFGAGLRLDPEGRLLAERLGLETYADSRLVRLHASAPPSGALGIERFASTPGLLARVRLLAGELVPSSAFMRWEYPLARRGRGGLAAAYAYRAFVTGMTLPRALRAWWAVR